LVLATTAHAHNAGQQPTPAVFAVSNRPLPVIYVSAYGGDSTSQFTTVTDSAAVLYITAKAPEVPMNPAAAKFVADYIRKNTEVLQKVEQHSAGVFKIMEPILEQYDVPVELKYLAVVESDLKRTAVSRVGAAGPWQLMPTTARELGLKVSRKADERKQYYKSTTAAAKYLRDLYNAYGDWLLVIAAYNSGPVAVNKAIKRAGSRNFWKLQYFLPAETRGHVKRFIGTHYYFENGGSETTLTKAEFLAHTKAVAAFSAMQQQETAALKDASDKNVLNSTTLNATTAEPVLAVQQK
jgi:membrane-bound lytic murein transglycosylase D